jgi:hypothetical protein
LTAVALLAAPASARTPAKQPKQLWVGSLTLRYVRHYELPRKDGRVTTELEDRTVTITNRPDGTATGSADIHVHRENYCSGSQTFSRHTEDWTWHGRISTVGVHFIRTRYQLSYVLPSVRAEVTDESCGTVTTHTVPVSTMPVGFQLYGIASQDSHALSGTWGHYPKCEGPCLSLWSEARWALVLRDLKGAGGGGGNGVVGPGGALISAGAGCAALIVDGTSGDDHLVGTAAAELLRGFDGNDNIEAGDGGDCVQGGAGDDVLLGGSGNDLLIGAEGADRFDGGPGNDELYARDGVAETVACGAGLDLAIVDAADHVTGCETIRRG